MMKSIKIQIDEMGPFHFSMMRSKGVEPGIYMATIYQVDGEDSYAKEIRLYCKDDVYSNAREEYPQVYKDTQMLQLHDQIKFCLLGLIGGRV